MHGMYIVVTLSSLIMKILGLQAIYHRGDDVALPCHSICWCGMSCSVICIMPRGTATSSYTQLIFNLFKLCLFVIWLLRDQLERIYKAVQQVWRSNQRPKLSPTRTSTKEYIYIYIYISIEPGFFNMYASTFKRMDSVSFWNSNQLIFIVNNGINM